MSDTATERPAKTGRKRRAAAPPAFEYQDNPRERFRAMDEPLRSEIAEAPATLGAAPPASPAQLRLNAYHALQAKTAPLAPATPGISNWVPLGPAAVARGQTYGGSRVLISGRVTGIVLDPTNPQIIYVASARGGIWKTTDGGVTWAPISDNEASLAIGALAIAPSSALTLYAGTGEGNIFYYAQNFPLSSVNESYNGSGILKTTNGGASWTLQGVPQFVGACFYRIAVHPTDPNIAFAATSVGLSRTTNGGTTWTQLTNGLPAISTTVIAATDIVIDPVTPATAYAAFWGSGVYRSTNATAANPTWTQVTGIPNTDLSRIALAIAPSLHTKVYAIVANGSDLYKGLYETVAGSGGATWQPTTLDVSPINALYSGSGVYGAYTLNVAVDIATPDVVYLSGVSLYKCVRNPATNTWTFTDVGTTFHPDNHAFAGHPSDHLTIYAGSDGGIYKSTDGGSTWSDGLNAQLSLLQIEFIDQHPTSDAVVFGGTQDNGTEQFRNSVVFYHAADGDGGCVAVDQSNPANVIHEISASLPNDRRRAASSARGAVSPPV